MLFAHSVLSMDSYMKTPPNFSEYIIFADESGDHAMTSINPIAKHVTKAKPSKAFEVVKEKLLGYPEYEEIGLKLYPLENEMPQQMLRQDADRELPIHM